MKCVLLVTGLLCGHAMAAGVFPTPGIAVGGPVDSNTVHALGAANALSNAIRAGRVLTLEEFGAAGDGVTDDTQALVNATAAAASTANVQGARIALLHKRYYLANGGTIPAGVSVAGPGDPGNDGPGWDPTAILPLLVLGRGAGVTLTVNGNLANAGVARAGVNLAPAHIQDAMANLANYTGTGITIGQAARVQNVITLGNALGYQVENTAQWHADTLRSDDLASIWIDNMHDVSSVRDFEAFPWLTARDGVQTTSASITGVAANGNGNLRVTTSAAHGLAVGNPVTVWGVQGMAGANGRWTVLAVPDATHFDISASSTPSTTATTTTTSYNVTVASTVGLAYGQGVSGPGIPNGATIWAVQPDTNTVEISYVPTAAASNVALTFTQPAYTSGGTVGLYGWERPGDCIRVSASEAPTFDNGFCFGHQIGVHLTSVSGGGGAGWMTMNNFQAEGADGFNPNSVGILIDGNAYASKIHLGGDLSSFWSSIEVNVSQPAGSEPTLIEGGSLYTQRQPNYGPSAIRIVSGDAIISDATSCQGDIFVSAVSRLQINGSDCTQGFGFGNQGYGTVLANITTSGTLFGDTPMATVRGGQGVGLGVSNPSGTSWIYPFYVSAAGVPTTVGPIADGATVRVALTGAAVPTIGSSVTLLRFTQTATVASQTIALSPCAVDTGRIEFDNYGGQITALSFTPSIAGWTNGATLASNTAFAARCDMTDGLRHRAG